MPHLPARRLAAIFAGPHRGSFPRGIPLGLAWVWLHTPAAAPPRAPIRLRDGPLLDADPVRARSMCPTRPIGSATQSKAPASPTACSRVAAALAWKSPGPSSRRKRDRGHEASTGEARSEAASPSPHLRTGSCRSGPCLTGSRDRFHADKTDAVSGRGPEGARR